MTRFLMVPEAQMRELEARMEEERVLLLEMQEQMQARIEASQYMARLYRDLLAGAGDVNFPAGSLVAPAPEPQQLGKPTFTPPAPLVVREGTQGSYAADTRVVPSVDRQEESLQLDAANAAAASGGASGTRPKYKVNRGGRPTYADVIAWEVPFDEFHIRTAWEIIAPMLETLPVNWRRSLRRSLENEKDPRFVPVPGREDWYRRVRGAEVVDDLVEDGDDEDEDQTDETVSGVGAPETVSEDWRG